MSNNKSLMGKIILIVLVLALGSIFIYKHSKRKEKENNLYKLGTSEQIPIKVEARGICIFSEKLLDISNTKEGETPKPRLRLLRDRDKIADKEDLRREVIKDNNNSNASLNRIYSLEELKGSIESNSYYKLPISSADSINERNKFYKPVDKADLSTPIRAEGSGYLANFTDGYEEILTPYNIEALFDERLEDNKKIRLNYRQKKFVDNKFYYILLDVKDVGKYNSLGIKNLSVTFKDSNNTFKVADYRVIRNKNGREYLLLTMNEGIELALKKRIINLSIELNKLSLMKIPSDAIVYKNNHHSVYYLSKGRVHLARVKKVYESDNFYYCLFKKEDIYSRSYLDKVEQNNKEIGYKTNDESYIKIDEIDNYSSIILNSSGVKVGDIY